VTGFDAEGVGRAAMALGAGRARQEDAIDPAAGLLLAVKTGDRVEAGDTLAVLHTNMPESIAEAGERLSAAVRLGDAPAAPPPLFHEV
jgi:thymidine phosphorylase